MIKLGTTQRGLFRGEFEDRYGQKCSIQESSLATDHCIWLGVDVDMNGGEVEHGRMHLTQKQAHDLIHILRHFVRVGTLGYDDPKDAYQVGTWVAGIGDTNRGIEGRIIGVNSVHITVQDNQRAGVEGQFQCIKDHVDLLWEPVLPPEVGPSRLERLLEEEDSV